MVRNTQGGVIRYSAGDIPSTQEELKSFLRIELGKIQDVFNVMQDGQNDLTTVAPAKPREGMERFADGTNWNPGSGKGKYIYYNAAWHFLG